MKLKWNYDNFDERWWSSWTKDFKGGILPWTWPADLIKFSSVNNFVKDHTKYHSAPLQFKIWNWLGFPVWTTVWEIIHKGFLFASIYDINNLSASTTTRRYPCNPSNPLIALSVLQCSMVIQIIQDRPIQSNTIEYHQILLNNE